MCRRNGLETRRRCGWLPNGPPSGGPPVWARKEVSLDTCPKSYISAESEVLVEEFLVRRRLGGIPLAELTARQVDAFVILEKELVGLKHGQQNTRTTA
ncbi:conserved hypothetical protein [Candidatus Sulfopaludibacter sp. SbA3]|nr:conserved hypothetical protein [Candidatus Sulfopaludibacter sp. SbA3]